MKPHVAFSKHFKYVQLNNDYNGAYMRVIWGLYGDNGKENGNTYYFMPSEPESRFKRFRCKADGAPNAYWLLVGNTGMYGLGCRV